MRSVLWQTLFFEHPILELERDGCDQKGLLELTKEIPGNLWKTAKVVTYTKSTSRIVGRKLISKNQ